MKHRIITGLVALLAALTVSAQEAKVPFMDKLRPSQFMEVGVHFGLGASSIAQNYSTAIPDLSDFTFTPGVMMSFGATAKLPIRNYLAIGTGLDFNINNYFWNMTILHPQSGTLNALTQRHHFYDLSIPLTLDLRFNVSNNVRWDSEIGGYLTFGLSGRTRTTSYLSSINSLGQSQVTELTYRKDYYKEPDAIVNGVVNLDWGVHLATGLLIADHYSVKAVMHAGLRDIARNFGVLDIHNHTLNVSFRVGYVF